MPDFTLDMQKPPLRVDLLAGIAGDWGEVRVPLTLDDGEVFAQAAFTAKVLPTDADDAATTVQRIATTVAGASGRYDTSDPLQPYLLFRLTPEDTLLLLTSHDYDVQVWVTEDGQPRFRTVQWGKVRTSAGITAMADLVAPGPHTVSIAPAAIQVTAGFTVQLVATERDAQGVVVVGNPVVWASSNPAVAQVDQNGVVLGIAAGNAVISATIGTAVGTAAVTTTITTLQTVPIVADAAARNAAYPAPSANQRVHRLDTHNVEMWTGAAWGVEWYGKASVDALLAGALAPASLAVVGNATVGGSVTFGNNWAFAGPSSTLNVQYGGSTRFSVLAVSANNAALRPSQYSTGSTGAGYPAYGFASSPTTGMMLWGADDLGFVTAGVGRWRVDANGHLLVVTDNAYDIGAAAASRPRNLYVANGIVAGGTLAATGLTTLTGGARVGDGTYGTLSMDRVTPNAGYNGTFRLSSLIIPGSGLAKHQTHFANAVGGGTTQHDVLIDGVLSVGGNLTAKGVAHVLGDIAGDLSYTMTLGSQVAVPAAARATSLFLDTAHGPGFNGAAQVILRRGGTVAWQVGVSGSAIGAKTSVDDFHFWNGTAFVAALNASGRLRLSGGLDFTTDNAVDIGSVSANRPRDGYFGGGIYASAAITVGSSTRVGATYIYADAVSGQYRGLHVRTAGVTRWLVVGTTEAESGADAGTNFQWNAYNDAGVLIDVPLKIVRAANGAVTMSRPLGIGNNSTTYHISLIGASTTVRQVQFGTTSNWSVVGTRYSGGDLMMAFNASQTAVADAWAQSSGTNASMLLRLNSSPGFALHTAPTATAAGDLATFWGQPVLTVTTAANMTLGTDTNVALGLNLNSAAGNARSIGFKSASVLRWTMQVAGAESGADAGAAFSLSAYTDTGAFIDAPFTIPRAAGNSIVMTRSLVVGGTTLGLGGSAGASALLSINAATGTTRDVHWSTAGVGRWTLRVDGAAEAGSNAGSNIALWSRDDTGASIDAVWSVNRAAGSAFTLGRPLKFSTDNTVDIGANSANRPRDGYFANRVYATAVNVTAYTPTGSADVAGVNGDVRWDASYVYVKTGVGWKRAALSTF